MPPQDIKSLGASEEKERRFAELVIIGNLSSSRAYAQVFNCEVEAAYRAASNYRKKKGVQKWISIFRKELSNDLRAEMATARDLAMKTLIGVVRSDQLGLEGGIAAAKDPRFLEVSYSRTTSDQDLVETVRASYPDRLQAAKELAKMSGLFSAVEVAIQSLDARGMLERDEYGKITIVGLE